MVGVRPRSAFLAVPALSIVACALLGAWAPPAEATIPIMGVCTVVAGVACSLPCAAGEVLLVNATGVGDGTYDCGGVIAHCFTLITSDLPPTCEASKVAQVGAFGRCTAAGVAVVQCRHG